MGIDTKMVKACGRGGGGKIEEVNGGKNGDLHNALAIKIFLKAGEINSGWDVTGKKEGNVPYLVPTISQALSHMLSTQICRGAFVNSPCPFFWPDEKTDSGRIYKLPKVIQSKYGIWIQVQVWLWCLSSSAPCHPLLLGLTSIDQVSAVRERPTRKPEAFNPF